MSRKFYHVALLTVAGLMAASGCCESYYRRSGYSNAHLLRPAPAPCDRCAPAQSGIPAAPVPVPAVPPPSTVYPTPATAVPSSPLPATTSPAPSDGLPPPPPIDTPRAVAPGVRLAPPEPNPANLPPQTTEPPTAPVPTPPPGVEERTTTTPLPVDIPGYADIKPRVSTGQKPFPDGVAWLHDRGYRTVLHVRAPGIDDAAARRQFERAGLRYLTLEVSPGTLTKDVVDRFNRLVGDGDSMPLFVYDNDGSLAGGLWYLHFRLVEGYSDDKARAEAARVGFRQEQDDNHRTMWIAVQKLLEANGR